MSEEHDKAVEEATDKIADKVSTIIAKAIMGVIALSICYFGLELAHKNGIKATLQMQCEKIKGFKEIDSLDVQWFSLIKRFTDGQYECSAKLKMAGSDGTERLVGVSFDAFRSKLSDDLKDMASGRNDNDWAVNWYPWGDEYVIKNLKSID